MGGGKRKVQGQKESIQQESQEEVDYSEVMYGRRHRERTDSLSSEMLQDRLNHKKKIDEFPKPTHLARELGALGHGKKTRLNNIYGVMQPTAESWMSKTAPRTATGAGGLAILAATATSSWPLLKHMLPEIAFAGHSNSGKSTLVNAMIGRSPRTGLAGVSSRAGWTDQVHFYQLGRKPPLLTLVDLPGYGHAVASPKVMKAWKEMNHNYMRTRLILSRVYVLVDCMRGLCEADIATVTYLEKNHVSWKVILTKCDHLSAEEVAKSTMIVCNDLLSLKSKLEPNHSTNEIERGGKKKKSRGKEANKEMGVGMRKQDESGDDDEEDEGSEYEGTIHLKDLMSNSYRLPSASDQGQRQRPKQQQQEEGEGRETIGADGVVYPAGTGEVFEDEDAFNEKFQLNEKRARSASSASASGLSSSSSRSGEKRKGSGDLLISEEGEILGGHDVDFSNLSSRNYAALMRSAKAQLQQIKENRDRELAEHGSVDYEIVEIEDEELLEYDTDHEDKEEEDQELEEQEQEDRAGKGAGSKGMHVDSPLAEVMRYVVPISATSGAGINRMWEDIRQVVLSTVAHPAGWEERDKEGEEMSPERRLELSRMVREHQLAAQERKRISGSGSDGGSNRGGAEAGSGRGAGRR